VSDQSGCEVLIPCQTLAGARLVCLSIKTSLPGSDLLWVMNPHQGCKFVLEKYLYETVCQERLENPCLMDLFLMMDANSSKSAMMAWNGLNFSFGSIANRPFHIN